MYFGPEVLYDTDDGADEEVKQTNIKSSIKLLKLARKANTCDMETNETIINAIPATTKNRLNRLSELHLITSYIHTVIRSTFDSYDIISHCSNLLS